MRRRERYRAELEGFFSRCDWLLLRMDRRRWMRPGVLAVSTLMRWGKSLEAAADTLNLSVVTQTWNDEKIPVVRYFCLMPIQS